MNFCDIRATVLLQSFVIMCSGCFPETENKRICEISGPKSGRSRLRNLRSGCFTRKFLKQCLTDDDDDDDDLIFFIVI